MAELPSSAHVSRALRPEHASSSVDQAHRRHLELVRASVVRDRTPAQQRTRLIDCHGRSGPYQIQSVLEGDVGRGPALGRGAAAPRSAENSHDPAVSGSGRLRRRTSGRPALTSDRRRKSSTNAAAHLLPPNKRLSAYPPVAALPRASPRRGAAVERHQPNASQASTKTVESNAGVVSKLGRGARRHIQDRARRFSNRARAHRPEANSAASCASRFAAPRLTPPRGGRSRRRRSCGPRPRTARAAPCGRRAATNRGVAAVAGPEEGAVAGSERPARRGTAHDR